MSWIAVEDSLPARDETVIVYSFAGDDRYRVWLGYLDVTSRWRFISGAPVEATHWMPLPKPPKG